MRFVFTFKLSDCT